MTHDDVCRLPATALARAIRENQLSPVDVADAFVERVERVNPGLNALTYFDADQVRADARELERAQRADRPLGPLHGVPFTIKDLTAMKGLPLTFGMVPLKDNSARATRRS